MDDTSLQVEDAVSTKERFSQFERNVLSYKCEDNVSHSIIMCPDCKVPDNFQLQRSDKTIIYKPIEECCRPTECALLSSKTSNNLLFKCQDGIVHSIVLDYNCGTIEEFKLETFDKNIVVFKPVLIDKSF